MATTITQWLELGGRMDSDLLKVIQRKAYAYQDIANECHGLIALYTNDGTASDEMINAAKLTAERAQVQANMFMTMAKTAEYELAFLTRAENEARRIVNEAMGRAK